jgi:hypothetical protein
MTSARVPVASTTSSPSSPRAVTCSIEPFAHSRYTNGLIGPGASIDSPAASAASVFSAGSRPGPAGTCTAIT